MEEPATFLDHTKLHSTFMGQPGDQNGFLVRIHPVEMGNGIFSLPKSKIVIGRDNECNLVLTDLDASRHHASIETILGSYIIKDMGSTNGTLVNKVKVPNAVLTSGDLIQVGKTILKFLRGNDVERQYHETVYSMMVSDGLTGVPNKRYLLEVLRRELSRTQRHHRPLALAIMDLDKFKLVNDTFGHLAGDAVLREFATRVKNSIRSDELFARYGGEEFVALLPEASLEQAIGFAERIRALAEAEAVTFNEKKIPITVSIGVAHTAGGENLTPEELIERADKKLYQAKEGGRNRVVS